MVNKEGAVRALRCGVCDRLLAEHAPTGTVIVCRTCKTRNVQK